LIDIGENRKNIKALVLGLQFKGMSLFCQGELESAQRHLVRALEYKARADEVGSDFPSMSMIYLSWTMHILGCHREALVLLQEAETIVRAQSPYRLAAWLGDGCILFAMREDSLKVIQLTQELIPLARDNGFKFWTNYGNFFRGWTLAATEGSSAGTSLTPYYRRFERSGSRQVLLSGPTGGGVFKTQAVEGELLDDSPCPLDAIGNLDGGALRLADHAAGRGEQPAVAPLQPLLALRPLARAARAMSRTRSLTLRLRLRSLVPTSPAMAVIFFIMRVSTRTPSPSRLESVG
jgi:hypothetical protein